MNQECDRDFCHDWSLIQLNEPVAEICVGLYQMQAAAQLEPEAIVAVLGLQKWRF
jgi:hypothetical protein